MDEKKTYSQAPDATPIALDDARRVKVLSPGMLVFKRFMRNKLAIAGSIIILLMFLFAFPGGWFSPYSESQVFRAYYPQLSDYAAVTINEEYRYTPAPGQQFDNAARAKMILAISGGETAFESAGANFGLVREGEDFYRITGLQTVASGRGIRNRFDLKAAPGITLPEGFQAAFDETIASGAQSFTLAGMAYTVRASKVEAVVSAVADVALASKLVFEMEGGNADSFAFRLAAQRAAQAAGQDPAPFEAAGQRYTARRDGDVVRFYAGQPDEDGALLGVASHFVLKAAIPGAAFSPAFRVAAQNAVAENLTAFVMPGEDDGKDREYVVERKDKQYTIRREEMTYLVSTYESPSWAHPLGTDGNGMDMLVRLMYGGRVSLMIGFVVVIIETLFGVVLGGVAGYFGKWVDNLVMRVVDVFNCIPQYPIYIIMGAIMDAEKVVPIVRIYLLMIAMGVLGWPAIARMVRGQILSLREQEFMTATEATGLSVKRRIFRHLVPNVIPQLIVIATMSLGSVILIEAVLSFLGLGVKFPMASWGSIINAVSNIYVMTNYLFVWIPAGMLILLTVLGFNFIGDGLRDAFDPKMKR
ncbi:MAG: ABC transporter permease [Oscillospiraceae bacterium]|jgi:peptide/nickel transport system permease protein|nr:ABC transporter permease [Oscillospiraceae bacterium]